MYNCAYLTISEEKNRIMVCNWSLTVPQKNPLPGKTCLLFTLQYLGMFLSGKIEYVFGIGIAVNGLLYPHVPKLDTISTSFWKNFKSAYQLKFLHFFQHTFSTFSTLSQSLSIFSSIDQFQAHLFVHSFCDKKTNRCR